MPTTSSWSTLHPPSIHAPIAFCLLLLILRLAPLNLFTQQQKLNPRMLSSLLPASSITWLGSSWHWTELDTCQRASMLNAGNTVNYRHIYFNLILMHLLKSGGGKHNLFCIKVFILVPNHHSNKIITVSLWKIFVAVSMRSATLLVTIPPFLI